jgi:subtilisin-like proprotein convertase family protein
MVSRHSPLRRFLAGALALYGALAWPGSASADTFTNNDGITITDSTGTPQPATPYPSPIVVSGMTGNITNVTVTLTGLTHAGPQDIDIVLVSPTGQSVILMSDNGGVNPVNLVNLTFDDAAAASLPDNTAPIVAGTFKPSNVDDNDPAGGDVFPAPAPAGPYGAALGALNGNPANGTWNLYVIDDAVNQAGSITSWTLDITTDGGSAPPGKLLVTGPGAGGGPHVRLFLLDTAGNVNPLGPGFFAYDPAFTGGVNVAVSDLDGDGTPEIITGPGSGGGPHVKIFTVNRTTGDVAPLGPGFFAYDPAFTGGVRVTAVDVDGDAKPEIITGPGPGGGPHMRVFKIDTTTGGAVAIGPEFFAYDAAFTGGVTLGAE